MRVRSRSHYYKQFGPILVWVQRKAQDVLRIYSFSHRLVGTIFNEQGQGLRHSAAGTGSEIGPKKNSVSIGY